MEETSGVGNFIQNSGTALSIEISVGIVLSAIFLLPTISRLFYVVDYVESLLTSPWDTDDQFDFIIVGAGSAGAVVGNRLSENFKVLLLEAGSEPNAWHSVPIISGTIFNLPYDDWAYYTVPQQNACLALNSQKSFWPRGRVLGGSSVLNFFMYLRGHKKDYERWANVTGDPRWNYENVLKMFKKSENYSGDWDSDQYHSHDGYLQVSKPTYNGMGDLYCKAWEEFGISRTDLNAPFSEGCDNIYYTQQRENGQRHDTYHAFLLPVEHRKNLTIRKLSQVTKVLFEGPDNRAIGVEYIRLGQKKTAYSSKELILSAGSINSPQILMLSGIGPKEQLESLEIRVLSDLPVGKNLQDHVMSFLGPFIVDEPIAISFEKDLNISAWLEFFLYGKGVVSSARVHATAFKVSELAKSLGQSDWPDLQHIAQGVDVFRNFAKFFTQSLNVKPGVLAKFLAGAKGKDSFQIINMLAHPYSRGEIKLASADPLMYPLIDPKYFENELDLQVLVEGARSVVELVEKAPTFKSINARLLNTSFPGCEDVPFKSDAYWRCYLRHYTLTLYHPVGTCAMGKRGSPGTVVDSELRVIGTKNLRVVDASVMPFITTANTNAPTIMIGEMGSEMILQDWS